MCISTYGQPSKVHIEIYNDHDFVSTIPMKLKKQNEQNKKQNNSILSRIYTYIFIK